MSTLNTESTEKLNGILDGIEPELANDLFNHFYVLNPLQFAKLLHSLSLTDAVKRELLALKVGQPPAYKGENLEILIERAMQQQWKKLADDSRRRV